MSSAAELSVILPTDRLDTIRRVLAHLRGQAERDRLEVVIVTPSPGAITVDDPAFEGFAGVRVVEGRLDALPAARAKGVRHATAPIVFLAETHCFPEQGWAAALIAAHRGPWTIVGPAITNANARSDFVGWANLFMAYGPWIARRPRGPVGGLPGHNTSFKRTALLEYGPALERMMQSDTVMIDDMRARGHALLFEPAARMAHLNISRPTAFAQERFANDRNYAAARSATWPGWRRALYSVASPLIPAVRLRRILGQIRHADLGDELLPRALPALVMGLVVSAFGELLGYAVGAGSTDTLYHAEIDRVSYVRASERAPASAA